MEVNVIFLFMFVSTCTEIFPRGMGDSLPRFQRDLFIHIAMPLLATGILEPAAKNIPAYHTAREVKFQ